MGLLGLCVDLCGRGSESQGVCNLPMGTLSNSKTTIRDPTSQNIHTSLLQYDVNPSFKRSHLLWKTRFSKSTPERKRMTGPKA